VQKIFLAPGIEEKSQREHLKAQLEKACAAMM